ncbi:MAG TPA: hypothetical protein VLL05_05740, partial [Terriglobales bacterium]|nr:hypothetical protein [Terriglobales bacterium]
MKAAGALILLVTVAFSSALADSSLRQSPAKHTPRAPLEGLAIVVNLNNPTSDISLPQLRSMLLGERRWWSHQHRIVLARPAHAWRRRPNRRRSFRSGRRP